MAYQVETLRYRDGDLELIDQRKLPATCEYYRARSAAEVAEAIRTMVVRGAPAIGCAAAYGVAVEAQRLASKAPESFDAGLQEAFDVLSKSRPTAVNLFWALDRMRRVASEVQGAGPEASARRLLDEAHLVLSEDIAANRALGEHGAALLPDEATVLTHCNAGALATAGHGTALGVVRSAIQMGKRLRVFVDETRPFLQGARLTAWELLEEGIDVTLVTDNAVGYLMSQAEIDAVVVGTDHVASNGDVANKIGTYMVAVLAHRHEVPFYVACPTSSIDPKIASGADISIEERAADEVTGFGNVRWAPEGVSVRNPAFDITPSELVTALITERGVITEPGRESLEKFLRDIER